MSDIFSAAADLLVPPPITSRWFCNIQNCDGEPHAGWHWCEHSLPHPPGEEYWRCRHARANQRPPLGQWRVWLVMAGRGFGKTRTGAEWLAEGAKSKPMTNWAAVAPTREDLKMTAFEGDSGLLAALEMDRMDERYNKSDMIIRLTNGSTIRGLSAERPEKTRGPNLAGAWLDEVGVWRYPDTYINLSPALRRGDARTVVTTTPRPTKMILEWAKRDDGTVKVTKGSMWDNAPNLSTDSLAELRVRWEGTRLGRQELEGELLEDVPGALWSRQVIEENRCEILGMPSVEEFAA